MESLSYCKQGGSTSESVSALEKVASDWFCAKPCNEKAIAVFAYQYLRRNVRAKKIGGSIILPIFHCKFHFQLKWMKDAHLSTRETRLMEI